jgi:hypothetical protein
VAEVVLNQSSVVTIVCQFVPARMPKHMDMEGKAEELRSASQALDHAVERIGCHRAAPLRRENKSALWLLLALQPAQRTQLVTSDRMNGGLAQLRASNVHFSPSEVDITPFEIASFGCPQAMSPHRKQHCIIAMTVAIAPRGLKEFLAFCLGQILTFASNCPVFCGWRLLYSDSCSPRTALIDCPYSYEKTDSLSSEEFAATGIQRAAQAYSGWPQKLESRIDGPLIASGAPDYEAGFGSVAVT